MISMTIKELEEKLNSLYDPKMLTFSVKESNDATVVSNYCPLSDTSSTMVKIGSKPDDIKIAIAYLEGQIDGYKGRRRNPDDFSAAIKSLETIREFVKERINKGK